MRTRLALLTLVVAALIGISLYAFWGGPVTDAPSDTLTEPPAEPSTAESVSTPVPAVAAQPAVALSTSQSLGTVLGQVYNGDGSPAAGAVVALSNIPRDAASSVETVAEITTAEDGGFSIADLPLSSYSVLASLEQTAARDTCQLREDCPVAEVVLVLKPINSIAGIVVGPANERVSDAVLYPVLDQGKPIRGSDSLALATRVDDDGRFQAILPHSGAWQFLVAAPGYPQTVSPEIFTGTRNARIRLSSGVSVSGRVLEEKTRRPIEGAKVSLSADLLDGPPQRASSDAAGAFTFASIASGDYLVNVAAGGYTLPEAPVTLNVGKTPVTNLQLTLVAGGVIRGVVLDDESGAPVPGIEVRMRRAEREKTRREPSSSGANGEFAVTGLPAGEYSLTARGPHRLTTSNAVAVHLQAGQVVEGIELRVSRGTVISGRVVNTQGDPVAGADVRGRATGWQTQEFSGADGTFILTHVPPDQDITLSASTSTATSGPLEPVVVPASGLREIEIVLSKPRDALLAGVVVDSQNRPIEAQVTAWPEGVEPFEASIR